MQHCFIKYNILRIAPKYKIGIRKFYEEVCGMTYTEEKHKDYIRYVYTFKDRAVSNRTTGICFEVVQDIKNISNPGYWKVGLTLQDVDAAVDYFQQHSSLCSNLSNAQQFFDIGYLTSFCDPADNSIELLQHTFKENFSKVENFAGTTVLMQPTLYPPSLGQITIRCKDANKCNQFYSEVLGMKLLSIQRPNKTLPFTLYFYAFTDEIPPNPVDLHAIENREWLWQQTFTQIEIQHRHGTESKQDFHYTTNDVNAGGTIAHGGFRIVVSQKRFDVIMKQCGVDASQQHEFKIQDPDGYTVEVSLHTDVI